MIGYDPSLVRLTSTFFVLCINLKIYLYNYSLWVELSMNIHEGKGLKGCDFLFICTVLKLHVCL